MKAYSTVGVARLLKVSTDTLHRWIRDGRIEAPPVQVIDGMQTVRLWTEKDLEKVRKYMAEHYWGLGSKKPRKKKKTK